MTAPWAGGQRGLGQERPPGKGGWELGLRSGRPRRRSAKKRGTRDGVRPGVRRGSSLSQLKGRLAELRWASLSEFQLPHMQSKKAEP